MAAYSAQQSQHGHAWDRCRNANVFSLDSYSSARPYTVHFNADAFKALDLEDQASGWHIDTD